MQPMEEWRPVRGYEGVYSVSNLGRVRRDSNSATVKTAGTILKARQAQGRKLGKFRGAVHLFVRHRGRSFVIASLVAEAFLGPRPPGYQINHRDGDPSNDAASNLEYVTRAENYRHARENGLYASGERAAINMHPELVRRGEAHHAAKLTEDIVRGIRAALATGEGVCAVARRLGVSRGSVTDINRGATWRHVT